VLQRHYSKNSVIVLLNYRCIIMGSAKQLWGIFHYLVLLELQEVSVSHIACGRLHVTEYVFPDETSLPPCPECWYWSTPMGSRYDGDLEGEG
jgi:hypothetical protein